MNILHFIKWKVRESDVKQLQHDLIDGQISITEYFKFCSKINIEDQNINTFEDLKANFQEYGTDIQLANQLMKNEPTICN
jgi:hypothetical protein